MNPLFALRQLVAGMTTMLFLSPLAAMALTIDNDIQTYSSLSTTTVTLSGRSELRLTSSSAPLSGCVVNLTSPDSWVMFSNVPPSAVSSNYLNQLQVNGSAAVPNTNCRLVQYGDGAVVIPQGPTFAPLQVFTGKYFTGSATSLQCYTAYSDGSLGIFSNNIASFKLKRGYTATIAQNANGSGVSKNYVAQDGDIEVSVMPDELTDTVSFVRIFPWRWANKKGMAGNISSGLNVRWDYNWNIDRNSTSDVEYVPIRQERWWPSLAQDWQARGSSHLLGYNEPDSAAQSNIAVADAIWSWPDLLSTGLRVGSPAVTDGGVSSWLYPFMSQADSAGLRVDFVAVHYYRCFNPADPAGAANQMYNFLKGIHDQTGRPIWVTEWNNGANWTGCGDPTYTQQAAAVQAMMDMMDNAPFVERYALYNWVEDVRRVKWDDGSLTEAGAVYRDKISPLSYTQVIPEVATPPSALYQFENDARDTSANGHAAVFKGAAKCAPGHTGQALTLSGSASSADHVLLSSRLGDSADFTFGAWVKWDGGGNWQRIFDLGNGTGSYLFLTPKSGSGTARFAIKNGGGEQQLNHTAALPINAWTHVAVTISGDTGKLFVNGSLAATNTGMTLNPGDLGTKSNYLGKSQFSGDPYFAGQLDDVQFLNYALSETQVAFLANNLPPLFTSPTISGGNATQGVPYSGSLAGTALDQSGDTITYSKVSGPAWLTVAPDGTLSGTPTFADNGPQEFIVYATDSVGVSARAVLTIDLPSVIGSGTWIADGSGNWSDPALWSGGFPANGTGYSADFSTVNLSADRTVTLDGTRNIGTLRFGDTSGTESWILNATAGSGLDLSTSSGTPSIVVTRNTATISAPLAGTAGFTKSGGGNLILAAENTLTGTLNVDSGSTSASDGTVRVSYPSALDGVSSILIRNNNTGSSTLELGNASGSVVLPATLSMSGRNNSVPAVKNINGTNAIGGTLSINSGGSSYLLQSDAGRLDFGGVMTSLATGTRTLTFQGAGDHGVANRIENGSATVAVTKTGTGTLFVSGAGTYTGGTNINGGALVIQSSGNLGTGAITVASGTTLQFAGGSNYPLTNTVSGGGAIITSQTTTVTGTFSGFTGTFTHNTTGQSVSFNGAASTSASASYVIATTQGSSQGMIAGGSGDHTLQLGALSGVSNSLFRGGNTATGTTTLEIGALHTDTTFAGILANGATKVLALRKTGSGALTLSGISSYTGATTVQGGTLNLTGALTGTTGVSVESGGTLSGTGSVSQSVILNAGGTIAPGDGEIGTLSVGGPLTTAGGGAIQVEVGAPGSSDQIAIGGNVVASGVTTIHVSDLGGLAVGSYPLLSAAGGISELNFAIGTAPAGFFYSLSSSGTALTLNVSLAPAAPVGLVATGSFGQIDLSWSPSAGATTYDVKRADAAGGPYALIGNTGTTAYTDGNLPSGTTYYYVVSARNGGVESADSTEASATTLAPPPAPWTTADIGVVGIVGSSSYNSGTYTVNGSGADIGGTSDAFQYVSQTLTGDGEIRARITSQSNSDPWAKAGVMIRDGSGAGATHALMTLTPGNGFSFQWRATVGGASSQAASLASNPAPNNWVRLTRSGNLLTGYVSADGVAWIQRGTATINMSSTVVAGLAVTSHNDAILGSATFDNVSVTPFPSPWVAADIGTTGLTGAAEFFGNTYTVKGSGVFGGTADGFRYVYQPLTADGSIIARVKTLHNTGTGARIGIMVRDTLTNNARMAALSVTGSGAYKWERRTTTGGSVSNTNSSSGTAPNIWIRLVRTGNSITASKSTNGTSWTTIGTATVTMASNCYIGIAVASGSTSTLNTSGFDNVTVTP